MVAIPKLLYLENIGIDTLSYHPLGAPRWCRSLLQAGCYRLVRWVEPCPRKGNGVAMYSPTVPRFQISYLRKQREVPRHHCLVYVPNSQRLSHKLSTAVTIALWAPPTGPLPPSFAASTNYNSALKLHMIVRPPFHIAPLTRWQRRSKPPDETGVRGCITRWCNSR